MALIFKIAQNADTRKLNGKGFEEDLAITYSMKLSYSIALFLPPLRSYLETSKSKTAGETANPRLKRASRNSRVSIFPLRSLSNLSKID